MTGTRTALEPLYRARPTAIDIVDVPELTYVAVDGSGDPNGPDFAEAIRALYAVSYGAHFLVKKRAGSAPRVLPLEALWWTEDAAQRDIVEGVALGTADLSAADRELWRWRALMAQPEEIDEQALTDAITDARDKPLPALENVRLLQWEEGRCAQLLHVGPYSAEGPTVRRLHEGIAAAGYRPRGHHHEIYLGDPRRSAPQRLRTILRQPVEPLDD